MRHAQTAARLTCRILKEANSEAEPLAPLRHQVLYQSCILGGLQDVLDSLPSTELTISQVQWLGVVHWTRKELSIQLPAIHELQQVTTSILRDKLALKLS